MMVTHNRKSHLILPQDSPSAIELPRVGVPSASTPTSNTQSSAKTPTMSDMDYKMSSLSIDSSVAPAASLASASDSSRPYPMRTSSSTSVNSAPRQTPTLSANNGMQFRQPAPTDYRQAADYRQATPSDYKPAPLDYRPSSSDYRPASSDYRSTPSADYRQAAPNTDYRPSSSDYRTKAPITDYRQAAPATEYRPAAPVDYRQLPPAGPLPALPRKDLPQY